MITSRDKKKGAEFYSVHGRKKHKVKSKTWLSFYGATSI